MKQLVNITVLIISVVFFLCFQTEGTCLDTRDDEIHKRFVSRLSASERLWLKNHPVITVATDPGWPPVEFTDNNGESSGMSRDYLDLAEKHIGIKFKITGNLEWQQAYALLQQHEIDMTISVAETPERKKFWLFTKPYMKIPIVISTGINVPYIDDMSELTGKSVAVVEGYAIDDWLDRDYPEIKRVKVKSTLEGLQMLQAGVVYAYIDNLLVIGDYQAKLKVTNIKIAGQTPYVNAQCMAVRNDWPVFAGILQKALNEISDAEKKDIYRRWLPVRYEYGFNYTFLFRLVVMLMLILVVLFFWTRKLSKEVKQRVIAEENIKTLLREKELILKEVHNRIKNNMNTIKGLLSLQLLSETSPEAAESLRDAESRVQSMIMLYERLYITENFRELSVSDYLQPLCEMIINSYPNRGAVELSTEIEDFILNIQLMTPLGIIVNELLTNVMKHAFTGRENGEIHLSVKLRDNRAYIIIRDNGNGIPESVSFNNSTGFGLELVGMLVEQIGGRIRVVRDKGSEIILEFDV